MLWKAFLLVGLIVLGIHDCSFKFIEIDKNNEYFDISVEHAVFHFNENQDDNFAYKFLRVRRSQGQRNKLVYLIDLEMGRTVCKKYDEDIDNCPLQEGQGEKKFDRPTVASAAAPLQLKLQEDTSPVPFHQGTMTKYSWLLMLVLIIPMALAGDVDPSKKEVKVRYFESIRTSNANVKQCVWYAMKEYNKGSGDKYVFLVDKTLHAKLQITDRMEYHIDVQISRSNCKKPLNNTENCVPQKNSKLEKPVCPPSITAPANHVSVLKMKTPKQSPILRKAEAWGSPKFVRPFEDIPKTYVYVKQALWYAMKEYNKMSKDRYSFKVVDVLKSQEQVTDSLEYYLEVKIARTMCKKIVGENENCLVQNDPKMKKVQISYVASKVFLELREIMVTHGFWRAAPPNTACLLCMV
ncbi:hypothetical protein STEG23_017330, partial [Scotinomys teguina]